MELNFKHKGYKEREEYEARVNNIKKEKKLTGDKITEILLNKLKADGLKLTTERNYKGINENPFDIIAGNEKDLELYGFEIKGDTDNFSRLKSQLQAYLFCFNKVYLVLHKKKRPEWLPEYVGVLRVFENEDIYVEENSYFRDILEVSTWYEWDALFRCNGLGITSKKVRRTLELIHEIRKNILFNRFFASLPYGTKKYEKLYPFTEEQKAVIIGFDAPYHYKLLSKDITVLETRIRTLKESISFGQKELIAFENKPKEK